MRGILYKPAMIAALMLALGAVTPMNRRMLALITIHEAMPGHYVQFER